jgi:hypothetical protein
MLVLIVGSPSARLPLPPYHPLRQKIAKKILHLWKFPVISQLRTNFAEMPGNRCPPWEPRTEVVDPRLRRRGGESESLEEEAIEIGNSYRIH